MDKNQNDNFNQQNAGMSKGKTNMDLDKTPGRVENAESRDKKREQNSAISNRKYDNRNIDDRADDDFNEENRNEQGYGQDAEEDDNKEDDQKDNDEGYTQGRKSEGTRYASSTEKLKTD